MASRRLFGGLSGAGYGANGPAMILAVTQRDQQVRQMVLARCSSGTVRGMVLVRFSSSQIVLAWWS